jgi:hypothetical protein
MTKTGVDALRRHRVEQVSAIGTVAAFRGTNWHVGVGHHRSLRQRVQLTQGRRS